MSFFSRLFRRKAQYVHPTFGNMCFQKMAPGKSYWEGRALFGPTKTEIEVFVDGDESGVAPGTLEFYEKVQERYPGIVAKFQTEIVRQLRGLSHKSLPLDFASTCRLSSVSVPDARSRKAWDIGMECVFDPGLSVTIEMEDWEKGVVVVDS